MTLNVRKILNEQVIDPEILLQHCSLDYGRHDDQSTGENQSKCGSLGVLDLLPVELQHKVLGMTDVASFLVSRRVNHRAMAITNALVEFKKVCTLQVV